MPHVIEPATSGRAKCRACDRPIAKGEPRFGERQPNAFGDGEMTLWFHLSCGAYVRPEAFLEASAAADSNVTPALADAAKAGIEHRRLPRIHGAGRAPTSRARCRHCKEPIDKASWRIALVFFEEYRFNPGGYIHVACAAPYFGTTDILERIRHFSPELTRDDLDDLATALEAAK